MIDKKKFMKKYKEFFIGFGITGVSLLISEPLGYFVALYLITLNYITQ
jgi:hypothetical protein